MKKQRKCMLAVAALACMIPAAASALTPYSQDFEGLNAAGLTSLGDDGWLVFGTVWDGTTMDWLYEYGPFSAPNNPGAPAFSAIAVGEGGVEQGDQQLSVFSDYENGDHANGHILESVVYREQVIGVADVGSTWIFEFQGKLGDLTGSSTAVAFIKTLDPLNGYQMTNFVSEDMTAIPAAWGGWTLRLTIDAGLIGQIFQIGFSCIASNYEASAVFYDNVVLRMAVSPVPDEIAMAGAKLRQNYPNPFNPLTRIDFSLEHPGPVDIAVYDLGGRLVSRLLQRDMTAGDHSVNWNGRTAAGAPAPAGQYRYVMKTAAGQVSRSMVLLK